jgi:hypothetical protein
VKLATRLIVEEALEGEAADALQQNERLIAEIAGDLARAEAKSRRTDKSAQFFKEFMYRARRSWSRRRRVVGKAEFTKDEANPRFVVTSLTRAECTQVPLREAVLRARRYGESDQGVPTGSVCRSHLDRHDAGKPAAPMVGIARLHSARCRTPDRAASHGIFQRELRHNPS